jgi:Flp pilus assembly CpaE family ATPase
MKKNKNPQLQRAEKLLEIVKRMSFSAEKIKLTAESYGCEKFYEEEFLEIKKNSKDLLLLLDIIENVSKNGEDQSRIFSC